MFASFLRDERGATAIEYGLIASLMGAAIVGGMNVWSTEVAALFEYLTETLDAAI